MPIKWLTLLITLLLAGPLNADSLRPFLPHQDRAPHEAWSQLQATDRADLFVQSIATRNGKSTTEVRRILDLKLYETRRITGWFYSDGWFASSGGYQVGSIYRAPYPNERGAYVEGKLWFSGYCANAAKPKPEEADVMVCTQGREVGTVNTVTGGFATNEFVSEPLFTHGSWEFIPLTCTFNNSGE